MLLSTKLSSTVSGSLSRSASSVCWLMATPKSLYNKDWECTKEKMDAYYREITKVEAKFYGLEFHHVPRDDNVAADVLSKLGSKRSIVPPGVFIQALNSPTVKMEEEPPTKPDLVPAIGQEVLTLDNDWRSPIVDFIKNNKSYPKGKEHEKLAR